MSYDLSANPLQRFLCGTNVLSLARVRKGNGVTQAGRAAVSVGQLQQQAHVRGEDFPAPRSSNNADISPVSYGGV